MATRTLEETVRQEQEQHERRQAEAGGTDGNEPDKVVDSSKEAASLPGVNLDDYNDPELALAKIDGNSVDRIAFTFSGTVFLDRSDKADVALYRDLKLGRDVTLMVEGKCLGTGGKGATNREGELDVVVGTKTVKVTTVYRPAVEDLAAELERTGTAGPDESDGE